MINHKIFLQGLKSLKGSRSPAIPLGACFIALGALLKDAGFNLQQSAASSLFTYALPGQLVMAESLLVGASIVNIFLGSSALQFAMSIIGVIIFAGLTAYDTQVIKEIYVENENSEDTTKKAVMGALKLYLDLLLLFQYLLMLFGNRE